MAHSIRDSRSGKLVLWMPAAGAVALLYFCGMAYSQAVQSPPVKAPAVQSPAPAQKPAAPPAAKAPAVKAPQVDKAYTVQKVAEHTKRLSQSPFVSPTLSSDKDLSIGLSHGWPKSPAIPRQPIIAYKITDPHAKGTKARVVLASGNHNTEYTGSWSLEGALDFLVSDEPEAAALRKVAEFYVYPLVNPDGRFTKSGRSNPEMAAQGFPDHNRAWLTSGKFSTIDAVKKAMQKDTGGSAEYLLDFHSDSSAPSFRLQKELLDDPLTKSLVMREIVIKALASKGDPGMLRNWSASREGLRVPYAICPEHANAMSIEDSRAVGRTYMLALHDLIVGKKDSKPAKAEPSKVAPAKLEAAK